MPSTFCSHPVIPSYLWQWNGCFLIALHINFPSWQSHGKDWLNLNCYYRVLMEPVMQKLMEVSHEAKIQKILHQQNKGWLSVVDWCSESNVCLRPNRPCWPCLILTLGMGLNIQSALTTAEDSSTASWDWGSAKQPSTLLTRESPSIAVIPASQSRLWAINQPGGLAPAGTARWSMMVLFLQTVEGHPYCATQAILLCTAQSPLRLPTASGSVTSS